MRDWTDNYWQSQGNLVYLSWIGTKDSNPTVDQLWAWRCTQTWLVRGSHPSIYPFCILLFVSSSNYNISYLTKFFDQQTWARIVKVGAFCSSNANVLWSCWVTRVQSCPVCSIFSCLVPKCQHGEACVYVHEACVYAHNGITNDLDISESEDPLERPPECTGRTLKRQGKRKAEADGDGPRPAERGEDSSTTAKPSLPRHAQDPTYLRREARMK